MTRAAVLSRFVEGSLLAGAAPDFEFDFTRGIVPP
jgi:hypothetical protein